MKQEVISSKESIGERVDEIFKRNKDVVLKYIFENFNFETREIEEIKIDIKVNIISKKRMNDET